MRLTSVLLCLSPLLCIAGARDIQLFYPPCCGRKDTTCNDVKRGTCCSDKTSNNTYQAAAFIDPQDGDVFQIFKATTGVKACGGDLITNVIVSYETGRSGNRVVLTSGSREFDIAGAMFVRSTGSSNGNDVVMQAEHIFDEQEHNKGEKDL